MIKKNVQRGFGQLSSRVDEVRTFKARLIKNLAWAEDLELLEIYFHTHIKCNVVRIEEREGLINNETYKLRCL